MDIGKINRVRQYQIEKFADSFRENFEKKTGKTIGKGANFNYEEIINFYGGKIEYADLGGNSTFNGLINNAYIQKINEDNYDFKMVIDKKTADKIKAPDDNGKTKIGNWNLLLMTLFYHVAMASDKFDNMEDGQIIYPDEKTVKKVLASVEQNQDTIGDIEEERTL